MLWPRSVAMIGAAPTGKHRTRGQLVRYLVGVGYEQKIYPINPSYQEVDGHRCYASVNDIGADVDVAVLALPAALIAEQLENCVRAGVKNAVILSAGFVEAGAEGAALQQRAVEIARASGLRLLGPNCQGFYNIPGKVTTTFSPTVAPAAGGAYQPVSNKRVGIIAQSGGIGYSLFARGRAAGLGFSYIVSTGNEADLTSSDFLEFMVQDERTDVIVLFCETVRDPERFIRVLAEAQRIGKPVIALKVGKSAAAQRAAASHTAALTGWDTGYRAVFERYGVIQVEHPDEAIAVAGTFATCPLPKGRRAGIITVSGGGGALMADMLSANGLTLPELRAATRATIEAYIPSHGSTVNPIDLTLNSVDLVMPTLELLEQSDEVDLIALVTQLASGEILPIDPVRMRAIMDRQTKPVVTWTYTLPSPAGHQVASEGGLFLHPDLRNCGRSAGALVNFAMARQPAAPEPVMPASHAVEPETRPVITEHETRRILAAYGMPAGKEGLATSCAQACTIAARIGYPVALKIHSADLPHKTEAGGVVLGITDAAALEAAYDRILASAKAYKPDARIDGVLVQAMAPKGYEVVIGMVNDSSFGPIMMVGLGGIAIELFGDVVHAPAPVSADQARAMLKRLKSSRLFEGFRGAKPVDTGPLADLVALVSRIALDHRERIAEMEFNPIILHADGSGITVADGLMILNAGVDAGQIAPVGQKQ